MFKRRPIHRRPRSSQSLLRTGSVQASARGLGKPTDNPTPRQTPVLSVTAAAARAARKAAVVAAARKAATAAGHILPEARADTEEPLGPRDADQRLAERRKQSRAIELAKQLLERDVAPFPGGVVGSRDSVASEQASTFTPPDDQKESDTDARRLDGSPKANPLAVVGHFGTLLTQRTIERRRRMSSLSAVTSTRSVESRQSTSSLGPTAPTVTTYDPITPLKPQAEDRFRGLTPPVPEKSRRQAGRRSSVSFSGIDTQFVFDEKCAPTTPVPAIRARSLSNHRLSDQFETPPVMRSIADRPARTSFGMPHEEAPLEQRPSTKQSRGVALQHERRHSTRIQNQGKPDEARYLRELAAEWAARKRIVALPRAAPLDDLEISSAALSPYTPIGDAPRPSLEAATQLRPSRLSFRDVASFRDSERTMLASAPESEDSGSSIDVGQDDATGLASASHNLDANQTLHESAVNHGRSGIVEEQAGEQEKSASGRRKRTVRRLYNPRTRLEATGGSVSIPPAGPPTPPRRIRDILRKHRALARRNGMRNAVSAREPPVQLGKRRLARLQVQQQEAAVATDSQLPSVRVDSNKVEEETAEFCSANEPSAAPVSFAKPSELRSAEHITQADEYASADRRSSTATLTPTRDEQVPIAPVEPGSISPASVESSLNTGFVASPEMQLEQTASNPTAEITAQLHDLDFMADRRATADSAALDEKRKGRRHDVDSPRKWARPRRPTKARKPTSKRPSHRKHRIHTKSIGRKSQDENHPGIHSGRRRPLGSLDSNVAVRQARGVGSQVVKSALMLRKPPARSGSSLKAMSHTANGQTSPRPSLHSGAKSSGKGTAAVGSLESTPAPSKNSSHDGSHVATTDEGTLAADEESSDMDIEQEEAPRAPQSALVSVLPRPTHTGSASESEDGRPDAKRSRSSPRNPRRGIAASPGWEPYPSVAAEVTTDNAKEDSESVEVCDDDVDAGLLSEDFELIESDGGYPGDLSGGETSRTDESDMETPANGRSDDTSGSYGAAKAGTSSMESPELRTPPRDPKLRTPRMSASKSPQGLNLSPIRSDSEQHAQLSLTKQAPPPVEPVAPKFPPAIPRRHLSAHKKGRRERRSADRRESPLDPVCSLVSFLGGVNSTAARRVEI